MRINPITTHPYVAPVDDFNEIGQPDQVKKKIVDRSYYKDTIAKAEHYLDTKLFDLVIAQRINHEESSKISSSSLKGSISASKEIRDDLFNEQDALIKKKKTIDIANTFDIVTMAGLLVSGVVTFFGIFLPVIIPALLAIGNAIAKIVNGFVKHQADQISAKIFDLGEQRKMHQTKSMDHMDQQNSSKDKAYESITTLSKNEEKKHETARAVMGRS